MDRRDFFKASLGTTLGLILPIEISATLTIVDIKLLDGFKETMKFGGTRMVDGQAIMDVIINTESLWRHVRAIDSEGREWQTDDQGKTWHCGLMEFSLKIDE